MEYTIDSIKEKKYRMVVLKVNNIVCKYEEILLLFELFRKDRRRETQYCININEASSIEQLFKVKDNKLPNQSNYNLQLEFKLQLKQNIQ